MVQQLRRRHSLASVRNLFRRLSGESLLTRAGSVPGTSAGVSPEPRFTMQTRNLEVIKYAAFLYDDEVVRVVLEQLYARTCAYGETTTVFFTYEDKASQLAVGQLGTLEMPERCDTKDSACGQNRNVGSMLSIGDLKANPRFAKSALVAGPPYLRAYAGTRLTAELSLGVVFGSALSNKALGHVQEAMRHSVAFARSLLSTHRTLEDDGGMRFAVDREGVVVRATPSCEAYFSDFFHDDDTTNFSRSVVGTTVSKLMPNFDPWDRAKTHVKGLRLDVSEETTRIVDAKCVHFERVVMVCLVDKTVRKKLGDREAELRIQRQVLSQLAHELRNKFTASIDVMQTTIECFKTLAPENLPKPLLDTKSDMNAAIQLLHEGNQLLETRLTLHRISQGAYDLDANLKLVDVARHLGRFADSFLNQRRLQFGVTIQVNVENCSDDDDSDDDDEDTDGGGKKKTQPRQQKSVALDAYVLDHVLTSTLSNAISHSPPNSRVSLTVHSVTESEVVIGVRDQGCGISKQLQSKLFDDGVLSAKERGVGLGLSSSAAYLRTVGGDIWLKSTSVARRASLCDFTDVATRPTHKGGHTDLRFRMVRRREREDQLYREVGESNPDSALVGSEHDEHGPSAAPLAGVQQIHVVEDSTAMRRLIVKKVVAAVAELDLGAPETFEYETVEHALDSMAAAFPETGVPPPCTLVTVDQNLQSKGGELMGTDLITCLIDRGYAGTIISASGEDAGAQLVFGKPLPNAKQITKLLKTRLRRRVSSHSSSDVSSSLQRPPATGSTAECLGDPLAAFVSSR